MLIIIEETGPFQKPDLQSRFLETTHANEYFHIYLWLNQVLSVSKKAISCCILLERTLPVFISTWWTPLLRHTLLKGEKPGTFAPLRNRAPSSSRRLTRAARWAERGLLVLVGAWGLGEPAHPALPMHTLVAAAFAAYSSLLDFGIDPGVIAGGAGEDDVRVLIHHPECGGRTDSSSAADDAAAAAAAAAACAAAASMFRTVSPHPVVRTAAFLRSGGGGDECGGGRGRLVRRILIGGPHSGYGSLGSPRPPTRAGARHSERWDGGRV